MGGWDGKANGWNRDVLERIVVLLLALADLADIAAGVSFRRRRQVIGILNCGEVEARAFVIGTVCGAPVPTDGLEPSGDAACLAIRLRALALMLCLLLARRFALPGVAGPRASRHRPARQADRQAAAPDTS